MPFQTPPCINHFHPKVHRQLIVTLADAQDLLQVKHDFDVHRRGAVELEL